MHQERILVQLYLQTRKIVIVTYNKRHQLSCDNIPCCLDQEIRKYFLEQLDTSNFLLVNTPETSSKANVLVCTVYTANSRTPGAQRRTRVPLHTAYLKSNTLENVSLLIAQLFLIPFLAFLRQKLVLVF